MKKIGIVDIIIILMVIVLCVAGYGIIDEKGKSATQSVSDVEFTVELKQLTKTESEMICEGDEINDSVKGGYYGKVVKVETKKATAIAANTIDGVYSADPKKDPNAVKYDEIKYDDIIHHDLAVIDSTASTFGRDNKLPILIFGLNDPENIVKAVMGEKIGTLVEGE